MINHILTFSVQRGCGCSGSPPCWYRATRTGNVRILNREDDKP
jgi:hypothetical protein